VDTYIGSTSCQLLVLNGVWDLYSLIGTHTITIIGKGPTWSTSFYNTLDWNVLSNLLLFIEQQNLYIYCIYINLYAFQLMLVFPHKIPPGQINPMLEDTIYLSQMHLLEDSVNQEFKTSNFVVKRSDHHFKEVSFH
jgi:hypothetical protein